jgi:diguanylate cyclase (GGDEF)-like protein
MEQNTLPTQPASPQNSFVDHALRFLVPVGAFWRLLMIVGFAFWRIEPVWVASAVGLAVYALVYYLLLQKHYVRVLVLVLAEVLASSIAVVVWLGWDSGFHYYFFLLAGLSFMVPRLAMLTQSLLAVTFGAGYIGLAAALQGHTPTYILNPTLTNFLNGINLILAFLAVIWLAFSTRRALRDAWYTLNDAGLEMKVLVKTDPLTQLLNRGYMFDLIEYERIRSERNKNIFSLLLFNIVDFKSINENYGREAGDYVLRLVGDVLRSSVRKEDQVARWAGDEFLLMLPDTDQKGVEVVAEKLRDLIRLRTYHFNEHAILVDVYFGFSAYKGEESVAEVLQRADDMLNEAVQTAKKSDQSTIPLDDGPLDDGA